MDLSSIQPFLDWLQNHPQLATVAVFAIAAAESLAIVGILVPGVVLMLGIGALVGLGVLELWSTIVWAAVGAIAGDGVSYWLGRHYDRQLRSFWPFTKHPELIPRGERFFHKHGGKSVLFGRFIGPIRPIIPMIAGIMHMNPYHFYFVNTLSAIAWAPVVLLPGVVFGTSLHLATEVGARLVAVSLLLAAVAWLIVVAVRTIVTPLLLKLFGRWEKHWDFVVRNAFNSTVVLIVLLASGAAYITYTSLQKDQRTIAPIYDQEMWWQSAWQNLPVYRDRSDQEAPLTVQWWGELGLIKQNLQRRNWHSAATLSPANAIKWLSPSPQIESLPILAARFNAAKESLLLVKKLNDRRQLIIRLWPAIHADTPSHPILWVATVSLMELREPYPKFFYPSINNDLEQFEQIFRAALPEDMELKKVTRNITSNNWHGGVLLIRSYLRSLMTPSS